MKNTITMTGCAIFSVILLLICAYVSYVQGYYINVIIMAIATGILSTIWIYNIKEAYELDKDLAIEKLEKELGIDG